MSIKELVFFFLAGEVVGAFTGGVPGCVSSEDVTIEEASERDGRRHHVTPRRQVQPDDRETGGE